MAEMLRQIVRWPGLTSAVVDFRYVLAQGITPGRAVIVTNFMKGLPAAQGTLFWSDGKRNLALPDCQLVDFRAIVGTRGRFSQITVEDERWRWRLGSIRRVYNQLDPNNKLTAWTIKSATEMAVELLRAMGVANYRVEFPAGLPASVGRKIDEYLRRGDNFPQTFANPPVSWDNVPPAVALAELADRFGCRVCYQPFSRKVLVVPFGGAVFGGFGTSSLRSFTVGFRLPSIPAKAVVLGAEAKHQARFRLEPVAEEWDGSFVPINQASYAPRTPAQFQITDSKSTTPGSSTHFFQLRDQNGEFIAEVTASSVAALITAINGNADMAKKGTATAQGADTVRFTGKVKESLGVVTRLTGGAPAGNRFLTTMVKGFSTGNPGWSFVAPPTFIGVQSTARLSLEEARKKAERSVWRAFRFVAIDSGDDAYKKFSEADKITDRDKILKQFPCVVPGFGKLVRRQQIIPTDFKVERLTPQPRDNNGIVLGNLQNPQFGVLPDYYSGSSEALPAMCYGTYANSVHGITWSNGTINTAKDQRIYTPFKILPEQHVLLFDDFIYRWGLSSETGVYLDPNIIYEGAVMIRENKTNAVVRPEKSLAIPGGFGPNEYIIKDDVVISAIGVYDAKNKLVRTRRDVLVDSDFRANYYLAAMTKKYTIPNSGTYLYGGILPAEVNHSVQQISWSISVDEPGPTTTIAVNTEISDLIIPYPDRRLAENLKPNLAAGLANFADAYGGGAGIKAAAISVGKAIFPKVVAGLGG